MFGSSKTTTAGHSSNTSNTTAGRTSNTGFFGRLRSSKQSSTAKKPVYSSNTNRTGVAKKPRKTTATGPASMSHHKKPTMKQKLHGGATVMSGKMHNNHQEVRAGEKEMQGKSSGGIFSRGTTRTVN